MVALYYNMDSTVLFESVVYRKELPEYVDRLNKLTNDYLHKARKQSKECIIAREKKYNFPYVQDPKSKLAYAFGATKTPHIYLFDENDLLIYRGAIDDNAQDASSVDEPFLMNALDQLLNGIPIKKTTSKAIGCSIKFN